MTDINLEGLEPLEVLEQLFKEIGTLLDNDPEYFGFGSLVTAQKTAWELFNTLNHYRYEAAKREGVAI